jgi:signal transduction histidine kinase
VHTSGKSDKKPFQKNKLMQIAGNIVSNAIKFTPQNGVVKVDLDITIINNQDWVQVIVNDSGVGMDQKAIDNILAGDASSQKGTGGETGYGFGLSLVKHLVNSLKGTLQIESTPGAGTKFEVRLPQ